MAGLDALVTEYRTIRADLRLAEQPGPGWSPIEAARQDDRAAKVAREIADLLAAGIPVPVAA